MAVEIHNEDQLNIPINHAELIKWVSFTLSQFDIEGDVCIAFVDEQTMADLNGQYRNQHKPTNILSFPSELPDEIQQQVNMLGDMIICPGLLETETVQLNKPLRHHWAHICVHGVLHLLGYDHMEENEAKIMQQLEIDILAQLNFPNPYCETEGAYIAH